MQTLVSREEYGTIEIKFWKRGRKVMGLVFGVVMCLTSIIQQISVLGFGLALSAGLVVGAITGVGFGWLWSWVMHRSSRKFLDRVYAGDVALVGEPPGKKRYPSRLPCNVFVTNNVTVGGILYIGHSGVLFVPHKRHRGEKPIELKPEGLIVWAVDWKPNWWGRTFVASGPRVLEVGSGDQRYRFALPNPDVVLPRIREALGQ
ncbi:hypothetical protein ACFL3B_05100 [Gemmatimonadota bacterium]